jgi:hypothetical protein
MRAPPPQTADYAPAPSECDATAVGIAPASPAADADSHKKRGGATPASARQRALALACFAGVTLLTCSYSLLLQLAKGADGKFAFAPISVTFVAELSKLAISTTLVYGTRGGQAPPPLRAGDCARAAVPAFLYAFQNNLVYAAMPHLTPPLYQLLSNLKIVATAVLTRVILHRLLTRLQVRAGNRRRVFAPPAPRTHASAAPQWLGVTLLALASALPGLAAFAADGDSAAGLTRADFVAGTAIMAAVACLSGMRPARLVLTSMYCTRAAGRRGAARC